MAYTISRWLNYLPQQHQVLCPFHPGSWFTHFLWQSYHLNNTHCLSIRRNSSSIIKLMNMKSWFKDTVILQEDFLQFRKMIQSFQVFYRVVFSFQDLKQNINMQEAWRGPAQEKPVDRRYLNCRFHHLQALQHRKLRRNPPQLIGWQINMGNQ